MYTDHAAPSLAANRITRHGIPLLSWPTEEPVRRLLAASRMPRLLMLAAECPPPVVIDNLEDWIRDPIDSADLEARATALARRANMSSVPPAPAASLEDRATDDQLSGWVIDDADIHRLAQTPDRVDSGGERPRPVVDLDGGVVRVGARWVALSERQLPVATVLVERFDAIVTRSELVAVYAAVSGSTDPAALKSMMLRLARRFAEVGLTLQIVRGRGFLLEHAQPAMTAPN